MTKGHTCLTRGPDPGRLGLCEWTQVGCSCLSTWFPAAQPSPHPALPPCPRDQVRDYAPWAARMRQDLQVEGSSQEPSSGPQKLSAHQWLRAELEAREKLWQQATQLGQQALLAAGTPTKEVDPLPWCPHIP